MVLKKKIFIILVTMISYSTFAGTVGNLKKWDSQKKYSAIITHITKYFNDNKVNLQSELSEKHQKVLYYKLKAFVMGIKLGDIIISDQLITEAQMIIELTDDFDLEDEYDCDELMDLFEIQAEAFKKSIFHLKYYVSLAYYTWNYTLDLTDKSGEKADLYSKERGPCLGGGVRYENAKWGVQTELCYGFMTATVGEDSKNIKYNQSTVPIDAFVSTSNIFWKPKDQVSMKLGMPIVYHQGDYSAPTGGSISDGNSISVGYSIGSEWMYKQFAFDISFGAITGYHSSFWAFKSSYLF